MSDVRVLVVAPDPASGDQVLQALVRDQDLSIEGVVRIDPAMLVLVSPQAQSPAARAMLAKLSPREMEVLQGLVEGQSPHESAERLHIAVNTLRSHTKHILAKLGATSSLQAASIAVRAGMRPNTDPPGETEIDLRTPPESTDDQHNVHARTT